MSEQEGKLKRHFVLQDSAQAEPFRSPLRGGGGAGAPDRDRQAHGGALLRQIQQLVPQIEAAKTAQQQAGLEDGFGLQIEFQSFPDIELVFESLGRERSGIELGNVRHDGERTLATVFVPDGKLAFFEKLIAAYLDESNDTKKGPKNRKLLNAIEEIRAATLEALWTDDVAALPTSNDETLCYGTQ
jgi:hypothetical protein